MKLLELVFQIWKALKPFRQLKKQISILLVVDIHFSSALAKEVVLQGADKIRINPGNFPKKDLKEMVIY